MGIRRVRQMGRRCIVAPDEAHETVLETLERIAPLRHAERWDNVGLLVGDRGRGVGRALLCIDATDAVLDEAVAGGCELLVAYHPVIFEGLQAGDGALRGAPGDRRGGGDLVPAHGARRGAGGAARTTCWRRRWGSPGRGRSGRARRRARSGAGRGVMGHRAGGGAGARRAG